MRKTPLSHILKEFQNIKGKKKNSKGTKKKNELRAQETDLHWHKTFLISNLDAKKQQLKRKNLFNSCNGMNICVSPEIYMWKL